MAKRIFELARDLGVTSKIVLGKCRAEGVEIKNHMSTVSAGLAATIQEWFSDENTGGSAVETTDHVDLKAARAEASKTRRRKKAEEPVEEPPTEQEVPQAPAEDETEGEQTLPETPVEQAEPAVEVTAEAEEPIAAEEPEAPAEEAPPAEVSAEEATEDVAEETAAEEPNAPPAKPKVMPAGPMVVPTPAVLKGPRVIRVERADDIPPPRRRPPVRRPGDASQPGGPGGIPRSPSGAPRVGAPPAAGDPKKTDYTKKRSPRRKVAGRTADGGEKLKEWRDKDLQERSERLAAAIGSGIRRRRPGASGGGGGRGGRGKKFGGQGGSNIKTGKVEVEEPISIKNISSATGIRSTAIIKKLMEQGLLATVNQIISTDLAETVMLEFDVELVVQKALTSEDELTEKLAAREKGETVHRAPIVTFLGHVDHGKTSLLDYLRKATVASGEAGGITQHIGAYRYDVDDRHIVFLDTPGHEAFTAMRARGANMTDVVVLVVAADDGIMPQTVEAISHAKAAGVPIVVALNKSDLPNANPNRAFGQLAEHDLQPQSWGGTTEVIETDAITGRGMDTLLETLILEAELLELDAEPDAPASGYVVESEISQGRGVVATLLTLNGTLKIGDILLAGQGYGRVRQMRDSNGKAIKEAGPATPIEVSGLDEVPNAGDKFYIVDQIDEARAVAEDRRRQARNESLSTGQQVTLDTLFTQIEAGQVTEVKLIIKADVQGSLEALNGSLGKLGNEEVRINILHSGVGGVTTGDVTLAEASNAIIIGFNVVAGAGARREAEQKGVDIRSYRVIYDIVEDMIKVLEDGLAPETREDKLGHAEVRQTFKVSKIGTIAGCYVTDGVVARNASVRIIRNDVVVEDQRKVGDLKRFKDDAKEVRSGFECGIHLIGYDDIKEGDILEFYSQIEIARTL